MGDGFEGLRQGHTTHGCAIIEQRGEVEPNPLWHRVLSFVMVGREFYSISPLLRNACLPAPDPIEALTYHLESGGLSRRDLESYLGSRARVAEVLNRKRPLSLEMIRRLHTGLGIAAEILIQPYALATSAPNQSMRRTR